MDSLKFLRSHRGFTLIEIAAVLVIIAILSTLAVKHMGGSGISLYGDADRLVADLRYAQSLAMSRGMNVQVSFNSNDLDWELKDALSFSDGTTGRNLSGVSVSPDDISITFIYPKGAVDLGESDHQDIVLTKKSKSITIRVYDETGYVEIQ
jgi:prepilin-type N-terminal cleavage/methylation domain-containing protein